MLDPKTMCQSARCMSKINTAASTYSSSQVTRWTISSGHASLQASSAVLTAARPDILGGRSCEGFHTEAVPSLDSRLASPLDASKGARPTSAMLQHTCFGAPAVEYSHVNRGEDLRRYLGLDWRNQILRFYGRERRPYHSRRVCYRC